MFAIHPDSLTFVLMTCLDRMPHVIGNFISHNVYNSKLRTSHSSVNPKACRFIDVNRGREMQKGHSWIVR